MQNKPILVGIKKTAEALDVGRTTVYQLMDTGELESVKLGKRRLIVWESITRLANRLAELSKAV